MSPSLPEVTIYTDGGCRGNPGLGGWGTVLQSGKHRKEMSGYSLYTTNNQMELTAAIRGFAVLNKPCRVIVYTDSQYVKKGISEWLAKWKRQGWKTSTKEPVKNADLWKQLDTCVSQHEVIWKWVKGHAGNSGNERCDQLANEAMDRLMEQTTPQQRAQAKKDGLS